MNPFIKTCVDCGSHFQAYFVYANCCDQCWPVSVVFRETYGGDEYFVNVPKRESEAKRLELIAEGKKHVYITELIQTAF